MRYKIIAIVIVALFLVSVAALAAGCGKAKPAANQKKVVSAVCPVMGTKIADVSKAAGKTVYKGKTYYFCCRGCKPLFDKDPEKYIKKSKAN
jgi:YHS domain-containing protein